MIQLLSELVTFICCGLIFVACFSGDWLLLHVSTVYPENVHLRAVVDSSVHAAVGGLTWAVVESDRLMVDVRSWIHCFVCVLLSALVDVDHFLAAGSLDIQKAVSLPRRPPFHNSSLALAIAAVCWILRRYEPNLALFSLMFLCAWFSHHLRDANHRGLWFSPIGHTPVFSFGLYVIFIIALALMIRCVYLYTLQKTQRNLGVDASVV